MTEEYYLKKIALYTEKEEYYRKKRMDLEERYFEQLNKDNKFLKRLRSADLSERDRHA